MELQKKLGLNLFKETSIKNKSEAQNLFIEAVKALYVEDIQSVKSVATSKIFTGYFQGENQLFVCNFLWNKPAQLLQAALALFFMAKINKSRQNRKHRK